MATVTIKVDKKVEVPEGYEVVAYQADAIVQDSWMYYSKIYGRFQTVNRAGCTMSDDDVYIRPIPVPVAPPCPAGYELVGDDEVIPDNFRYNGNSRGCDVEGYGWVTGSVASWVGSTPKQIRKGFKPDMFWAKPIAKSEPVQKLLARTSALFSCPHCNNSIEANITITQ